MAENSQLVPKLLPGLRYREALKDHLMVISCASAGLEPVVSWAGRAGASLLCSACAAGCGDGNVQRVCLASLHGAVVRKEVLGTSFKGDRPVMLVEHGREGRGECFCFSVLKIAEGCLPSQEWWILIILAGKKKEEIVLEKVVGTLSCLC